MTPIKHSPRTATGAALAIALILLVVITLLALAGMRTAGLGFIMAGNEQYRQKAFLASESGIEEANTFGIFNPAIATQAFSGTVPGAASDTYAANINRQLSGAPLGALWGSSFNSFSTYHFEIQSTGTSVRSSTAPHVQGVAILAPISSTFTGAGGL